MSKTDGQLDGLTCWVCGRLERSMILVGWAPYPPSFRETSVSQIFADLACWLGGNNETNIEEVNP